MKYRKDFKSKTRFNLRTQIGIYTISTVDVGLNMELNKNAKPLYYETMIFNYEDDFNPYEFYQERYTTIEDAICGHYRAYKFVKHMEDNNI